MSRSHHTYFLNNISLILYLNPDHYRAEIKINYIHKGKLKQES